MDIATGDGIVNFLQVHPLFGIGVMLLGGYFLGRIAGIMRLPEITGFILTGLLMGGEVFAIVGDNAADDLAVITEVALGLIAFTLGSELRSGKLKRMGKSVTWITIGQLGLSFALVSITLSFTSLPWPIALLLGPVAMSTSPAAIVHIVQSTRARGRFVDHLFGTVALGDAVAIALFGLLLALTPTMLGGDANALTLLTEAVNDLSVSVVLGAVIGTLLSVTTRRQNHTGELFIITLGFVFLSTAMAVASGLSPLLINMVAGATLANLSSANTRVFRSLEPMTPPVYALFFVIAGTKLKPSILLQPETLILGGLFILARALGKYAGAGIGATLSGADIPTRRWLGLSLFAHAGVALGLILLMQAAPELDMIPQFPPELVETTANIVLMSVFVNEIVGPVVATFAVRRACQLED
ncbi:MAG: cation:proton antiporter [Spirochaetota bacterium]